MVTKKKPDLELMNDKSPNLRREVAERIASEGGAFASEHLPKMMNDKDWGVRWKVARGIGVEHLPMMMNDKNPDVREEVAKRIGIEHLPKMMNDEDPFVCVEVARRIGVEHLPMMMNDEDSDVRLKVAERIDPKFLGEMFGFDFSPEYQKGLIKILAKREDLRRV